MKSSRADHVRRQNAKRARRQRRLAARQFGTRKHIEALAHARHPLVTSQQVEEEVLKAAQRELQRRARRDKVVDIGAEKLQAMLAKVATL